MTDHTNLIARLRLGASISRERKLNLDYAEVATTCADALEVLQAELGQYPEIQAMLMKENKELRAELEEVNAFNSSVIGERNEQIAKLRDELERFYLYSPIDVKSAVLAAQAAPKEQT